MIAAALLFLAAQPAAATLNAKEAARLVTACGLPASGLLADLPAWDGTPTGLATAGTGIERLCGLQPGSSLVVRFGALTFPAERLDPARITSEDLLCLTQASRAAGIPFGFIGNEAYARRDPASGKPRRLRRRR